MRRTFPFRVLFLGAAHGLEAEQARRATEEGLPLVFLPADADPAQADLLVCLDPQLPANDTRCARHLVALTRWDDATARDWLRRGVFDCVRAEGGADLHRALLRASHQLSLRFVGETIQTLLDAIPAPVFFKDSEGIYLGGNQAFADYIGVPIPELRGKTVYDVAPQELAEIYDQADRELLAQGGNQHYEADVRYADGSRHHVAFHKAIFENLPGISRGQVGVMFDISDRKALEDRLKSQALTDPLTQTHNRRSFMSIAVRALEQARRKERPLSLLVMDLDHFKEVNDRHGHAGGDRVLVEVVHRCEEALRPYDVLCRAGGEEFFVLLPDTSLSQAQSVAERLREGVASMTVNFGKKEQRITISIGVAESSKYDKDIDAWLNRADKALYAAKAAGRNKVVLAKPAVAPRRPHAPRDPGGS